MQYTDDLIKIAIGKICNICGSYILECEAFNKDFHVVEKRKSRIFVHKKCIANRRQVKR